MEDLGVANITSAINKTSPDETVPSNCNISNYNSEDVLNESLTFWFEFVIEGVICIIGLSTNFIAIPLLVSSKFISRFNCIVVTLCVVDNIFLVCSLLDIWQRFIFPTTIHQILFVTVFYQIQSISLTCSIYGTVSLALERCLAVSNPVNYHIQVNMKNRSPWHGVFCYYFLPTLLFSILFNVPKFFEIEIVYRTSEGDDNESHIVDFNPTALRLNEDYVVYYVNLARFWITGIIPFVALVFLNLRIHRALKARKDTVVVRGEQTSHVQQCSETTKLESGEKDDDEQAKGKGVPSSHVDSSQTEVEMHEVSLRRKPRKRNDSRSHVLSTRAAEFSRAQRNQSILLFIIVIMFLLCNIPRIILNGYEMLTITDFRNNLNNPCYRLPRWVVSMTQVSLNLISLNSSTTLFIYCIANERFRVAFLRMIKTLLTCKQNI